MSQTKKAFRVTTKSGGILEADDLVQRRFQADRPGEIWVSDITYIRTREGWLYLAAVLDLHNELSSVGRSGRLGTNRS